MKKLAVLFVLLMLGILPIQSASALYKIGNIEPQNFTSLKVFGGARNTYLNTVGVKVWLSDNYLNIIVQTGLPLTNTNRNSSIYLKNRVEFYWGKQNPKMLTITPEGQVILTKLAPNSTSSPGSEIELPVSGVNIQTFGDALMIQVPNALIGVSPDNAVNFDGDVQVIYKQESWSQSSWYATLTNPEHYITYSYDSKTSWDAVGIGDAKAKPNNTPVIVYGVVNYAKPNMTSLQDLWKPEGIYVEYGITPALHLGELIYAKGIIQDKKLIISEILKRGITYPVTAFSMNVETIKNILSGIGLDCGPVTVKSVGQITGQGIEYNFDYTTTTAIGYTYIIEGVLSKTKDFTGISVTNFKMATE